MSYLIRLFATSSVSSLVPVQNALIQMGYQVQPAGTNQLDVYYDSNRSSLSVDLTHSTDPATLEDIMDFIERVAQATGEPEQSRVLDNLARAQSVVAIGVPDDYDNNAAALNDTIDVVVQSADGLFQVDGDGFYDGSQLILPL
jgi:hypothetical protein